MNNQILLSVDKQVLNVILRQRNAEPKLAVYIVLNFQPNISVEVLVDCVVGYCVCLYKT